MAYSRLTPRLSSSSRCCSRRWRCWPITCRRSARRGPTRCRRCAPSNVACGGARDRAEFPGHMTERGLQQPLCPHLWLIKVIGVIVPRRLRADWRQEWEAELRHREELLADWDKLNWKTKLDLLRRSAGAFWDALLLQPRRLEDEMFQDLRFGL